MSRGKQGCALALLLAGGLYLLRAEVVVVLVDHFHDPGSAKSCFAIAENLARGRSQAAGPEDDRVVTWCDKTLAHDPRHTGALVLRAKALLNLARREEAVRDLEKARELDPTAAEPRALLRQLGR